MISDHPPLLSILIADSHPQDVTILKDLLSSRCALTITTDPAPYAAYDLLLLSADLLTGAEDSRFQQVPTIVIFDHDDHLAAAAALRAGAVDYLTRPLESAIVRARIETHLNLRRMSHEHEQVIENLQNIHDLRDRFFSIASHDLKNPINNIRMAMFLLDDMTERTDITRKILRNVDMALNTMESIVSDFLEIAALQSPALDLELANVKVDDLLWEVVLQYSMVAMKKNINLQMDEVDGVILADARRMQQVIGNLISNAIKYSPTDKTVTISARLNEDNVRIQVADEGPGIPLEERDRLFQEFGRLSPRPTGGETSTGLGLWIVKQLIEMQHGRVGADFPADGGTIFWVELPIGDLSLLAEPASLPSAV